MGEVVAFQIRAKAARQKSEPPTGDAQILFFLGVRYMRIEEMQQSQGALAPDLGEGQGPRGGKKRKSRARA
jgi:hypothetical protein